MKKYDKDRIQNKLKSESKAKVINHSAKAKNAAVRFRLQRKYGKTGVK